jgi:lysophospholipase L1-like esterase
MTTKCMLAAVFAASMAFAQQQAPVADAPLDAAKLKTDLDRATRTLQDWPALKRYRDANTTVAAPAAGEERVVFMGDSITDGWGKRYGQFFPGKPYINRGISGQTTPQMLVRFRPDVIALQPKVVVILAGTNDISSNTGPSTPEMIQDNMASMVDLAQKNNIKVVLSSVMPVCDYIQNQTRRRPNEQIIALNKWIKDYAAGHNAIYLDYYTPMLDDKGVLKHELTYDGLHPNSAGYEIMMPLAQKAIDQALGK